MSKKAGLRRQFIAAFIFTAMMIAMFAVGPWMAAVGVAAVSQYEITIIDQYDGDLVDDTPIDIPEVTTDDASAAAYDEYTPTPTEPAPDDTAADTVTPAAAPATTLPSTGFFMLGYSALAASLMGTGYLLNRRKK